MEAFEGYWRKMPSVKRLVFKSVPESNTRLAMLKRGEIDVAYLLEAPQAQEVQARSEPQARLLRRASRSSSSTSSTSGIRSRRGPIGGCGWPPATPSTAGRCPRPRPSARRGRRATSCRRPSSSRCPSIPRPTTRRRRSSSSPRRAIPTGSTRASSTSCRRTSSLGEAILGYLRAVGIRLTMRPMERAAFSGHAPGEEAQGASACARAPSTATRPRGCRR